MLASYSCENTLKSIAFVDPRGVSQPNYEGPTWVKHALPSSIGDSSFLLVSADNELRAVSLISATCMTERSTTGVPGDRGINQRFKSKTCCNAVKTIAVCGSEGWLAAKDKRRLAMMGMKNLRCITAEMRTSAITTELSRGIERKTSSMLWSCNSFWRELTS